MFHFHPKALATVWILYDTYGLTTMARVGGVEMMEEGGITNDDDDMASGAQLSA